MSGRRGALLARLGITLLLLAFAGLAGASGLDRLSALVPAIGRNVPERFQAQAARSATVLALARTNPDAAIASARRAVASDPFEPASTSLLGTAYLLGQQPAEADAAFRVAARFGWREPATQLYWYQAALLGGDLPRAVDRADALLRTHPGLSTRDEMLLPLESTPEGRAALIVRLAGRPLWLTEYLAPEGDVADETLDRRSLVLAELAAAGTRLGCEPVAYFVSLELTRGARRNAEQVWSGHCPGAELAGGLADGNFARFGSDDASPFGWRTNLSGDVSVRTIDKERGDRAVGLINRSAVSRLVLRQAVALEPGTYRLTAVAPAGRVAASFGCGGPPAVPSLTNGDPASGGQTLTVERCPTLELGLWVRPSTTEVELDSVAIERVR